MSHADKKQSQQDGRKPALARRLVRPNFFVAPRGCAEPDGEYRSRFGFIWWFWVPRIHTQLPDQWNPRVLRLIWLCFAVGIDIWGPESRDCWPNTSVVPPVSHDKI